jgi:uncharacterized protein YndB with AHSA1/START domain
MTQPKNDAQTVQVYRIFIRATPQAIWDAITQPHWTARYGYAAPSEFELRRGGAFRSMANAGMKMHPGIPDVIGDGEVLECDPPIRLVHTWRMLMTPELKAEGFTRVTYELKPGRGGVTQLTVTHDLSGAPQWAAVLAGKAEKMGAGGGWAEVLSGLKTLLETGHELPFQSGRPVEG